MLTVKENSIQELKVKATNIRMDIIKMLGEAGSGHPGGSLSIVDILTILYFRSMNIESISDPQRDRFVLSKGHSAPALYATLAAKGFYPREELNTLRKLGSPLQGHPDMRKMPGIEMSTGSLGQGLSAANGMALASKLDGEPYRVYSIIGDGEVQEGQIWEAAMTAAHYKLDNLTVFLDYNGLQIDGPIADIMSPEPLKDKWEAFGWFVQEVDGHDYDQLITAIEKAQEFQGKPSMIIAKTLKGKGVSFMEDQVDWHGSAPNPEEVAKALEELQKRI